MQQYEWPWLTEWREANMKPVRTDWRITPDGPNCLITALPGRLSASGNISRRSHWICHGCIVYSVTFNIIEECRGIHETTRRLFVLVRFERAHGIAAMTYIPRFPPDLGCQLFSSSIRIPSLSQTHRKLWTCDDVSHSCRSSQPGRAKTVTAAMGCYVVQYRI